MKSAIALIAVAGFAGAANAQATVDVLVDGSAYQLYEEGFVPSSVLVTMTLNRNGSTQGFYNTFQAWSQFGGDMVSTVGSFVQPVEGPDFSETQAADWKGRRPPAFPVPGGSGGGFRYPGANQGVGTAAGGNINGIAGIAQSAALGGFSQDTSPSILVYKANLDLTGATAGIYTVEFQARLLQIFISAFNIERAVLNDTTLNAATIEIVPTPASVALLGLGGLAATRRRR